MPSRVLRHKRIAQGLCGECGDEPILPGGTLSCTACLEARADKAKALREERKRAGICLECGGVSRPHRCLCQECADYRKERIAQLHLHHEPIAPPDISIRQIAEGVK